MAKVIIPKTYVPVKNPLIFLAGPIGNAPNWQDQAIKYLFSLDSDLTIASPRREVGESVAPYLVSSQDSFPRQRAWERHYLDIASKTGAVLFWLPGEAEHRCEKVYGAMTRLELGQWMTNYRHDKDVRLCIGSDGKFSELHTIKYDLELDAPELDIKNTLEETCLEAIKLSRQ